MALDPVPGPGPSSGGLPFVFFERRELDRLMRLYGQRVAAGEWRDYAIAGLTEVAVFSIFRRASEQPLYRIEKRPALARKQGAWSVVGQGGMILRRGHELEQVLRMFETGKFKVVGYAGGPLLDHSPAYEGPYASQPRDWRYCGIGSRGASPCCGPLWTRSGHRRPSRD